MDTVDMSSLVPSFPEFDLPTPPLALSWSDTQFEIIAEYVKEFQRNLDDETDIGVMLTNFGHSVLMEVTEIRAEYPVLMVFKGFVNGKEATLIQHINQLNFLLTTVPKLPETPHRQVVIKGFTADSEAE